MKSFEDDPEMFIELQHVMAQSYCDSPEHRKTWLEEIAKKHEKDRNLIESAMCHVHIGGLIAEILFRKKLYPHGSKSFLDISSNVGIDESKLKESEDSGKPF